MSDFKQSEETEEKKIGKDLAKGMPKKTDEVQIMFKQNRRYELKIGRNYHVFDGREKKKISRKELEHPDFTPAIAKYFVVQEVK